MISFNAYQRARLLLLSSAILCFCGFWWGGVLFRVPVHRGYEASLLQQPQRMVAILLVAMGLFACVAIGTAVAGMIRFNAGMLTAGIGLSALSARGGTIRDAILWELAKGHLAAASQAAGAGIFLQLALETALLAAVLGLLWLILLQLHHGRIIQDREGPAVFDEGGEVLMSLTLQGMITALMVLLLAATEAKHQVVAATAIGSFIGAVGAQALLPTTPRSATWLPPMLVGIVGYLLAYFDPAGIVTANLHGWTAGLARPLPLDYAGIGMAAAVMGHWIARQWTRAALREKLANEPLVLTMDQTERIENPKV